MLKKKKKLSDINGQVSRDDNGLTRLLSLDPEK